MKLIILVLSVVFSISVAATEYKAGQTWTYKNRFLEGNSTLTILMVEEYSDLGIVLHVRIDNINMTSPLKGDEINVISHLPFKKVGIDLSVTKLISDGNTIPKFHQGYNSWKLAYDAGIADAFETSVEDIFAAMLGAEWVVKE